MGGSQHQRSFPRRVLDMAAILSDYCRMMRALTYSGGTEENFIIHVRFEGAGEPAKSINQRSTKHYSHGVCHVIDLEQLFVKVCFQHRPARCADVGPVACYLIDVSDDETGFRMLCETK